MLVVHSAWFHLDPIISVFSYFTDNYSLLPAFRHWILNTYRSSHCQRLQWMCGSVIILLHPPSPPISFAWPIFSAVNLRFTKLEGWTGMCERRLCPNIISYGDKPSAFGKSHLLEQKNPNLWFFLVLSWLAMSSLPLPLLLHVDCFEGNEVMKIHEVLPTRQGTL